MPKEAGNERANMGDHADICNELYPKFQLKMKKQAKFKITIVRLWLVLQLYAPFFHFSSRVGEFLL